MLSHNHIALRPHSLSPDPTLAFPTLSASHRLPWGPCTVPPTIAAGVGDILWSHLYAGAGLGWAGIGMDLGCLNLLRFDSDCQTHPHRWLHVRFGEP